jgi:hypothetical protein
MRQDNGSSGNKEQQHMTLAAPLVNPSEPIRAKAGGGMATKAEVMVSDVEPEESGRIWTMGGRAHVHAGLMVGPGGRGRFETG